VSSASHIGIAGCTDPVAARWAARLRRRLVRLLLFDPDPAAAGSAPRWTSWSRAIRSAS